jgi:hypothetical protein
MNRLRDVQPEGFDSFEIDNQLEFGRLLDGEVAWLGAFQDFVDIPGRSAEHVP